MMFVFSVSTSILPSVTPRIILDTEIQDIDSGFQRTRAQIGELLRWEIDGPGRYRALAYSDSRDHNIISYSRNIMNRQLCT